MNESQLALQRQSPNREGKLSTVKKYTLVLDLDETLIHYVDNNDRSNGTGESYFLIRPYCGQFLREMA